MAPLWPLFGLKFTRMSKMEVFDIFAKKLSVVEQERPKKWRVFTKIHIFEDVDSFFLLKFIFKT